MAQSSQKSKSSKKRRKPGLKKEEAEELYARLAEELPEPKTELEYHTPYTLLVAVVLSAQATDVGVNKATKKLYAEADTPEDMVELGEDRVRELIKSLGLFRNKAKNVVALSRQLLDEHDGEVPEDRDALEALPGVGRKTANVVMSEAFGEATIAVDTHVFRVSNRTKLAPGDTPEAVEERLMQITPQAYLHGAHHWLILHGRYVCKARTPECWRCAIADICKYKDKTPAPKDKKSRDDTSGEA